MPAETGTIREAIGVFNRPEELQSAIDELLVSGFNRAELSLLAGERTVQEKLGHQYQKADELVDDPQVPRAAYVSPEAYGDAEGAIVGALVYVGATTAAGIVLVSGGTLAAGLTATALAGGAGGVIGAYLAKWIGDRHARYLQEQMDRGGLLLWVRTRNADEEERALSILRKYSDKCVHLHTLPKIVYNGAPPIEKGSRSEIHSEPIIPSERGSSR